MPIFGSSRATAKPGRVGLDDERGDAGVARVGVGLREDGVEARDAGVRDEALPAVEDVLVAVAPRGRAHRGASRSRSPASVSA